MKAGCLMEEERINKYISERGICSRRKADEIIKSGRVSINGKKAEIGEKVLEGDEVKVDGKLVSEPEKRVYIALNKPRGIICTTDKRVRDNIVDYINYPERIFPVGRLDVASEGLIILTNDGDIVNKILRSKNNHEKEYIVTVDKEITEEFLRKMSSGVKILDTVTKKCSIKKESKFVFRIVLTQGLNRQVRRMCETLEYNVTKLKRVRIMNIEADNIPYGKWRYLTDKEIKIMKKLLI